MDNNFSVGLSGMSTAALGVQVTANNVANVANPRSEEFQAGRLDQADQQNGATRPTQIQASPIQASPIQASREQAVPPGGSNTQLERDEMVNLARDDQRDDQTYTANAAVVATQNQAMGAVMDMRA